jgi:MYXO-CTERM domain-containing protein
MRSVAFLMFLLTMALAPMAFADIDASPPPPRDAGSDAGPPPAARSGCSVASTGLAEGSAVFATLGALGVGALVMRRRRRG